MSDALFAGYCSRHDGAGDASDDRIPYVTTTDFDPLWAAVRDLGGHDAHKTHAVTVTWDEPVLSIDVFFEGALVGAFELTRLTDEQEALLNRLSEYGYLWGAHDSDPALLALEVDSTVAGIAALVDYGRPHEGSDYDVDPDDPQGVLAFARELARAGVSSWEPHRLQVLATVAQGWTSEAGELLRTVDAVLCAPQ